MLISGEVVDVGFLLVWLLHTHTMAV